MQQIPYTDYETGLEFSVKWAMPDHETFNIKPIRGFIKKHTIAGKKLDLFPHPFVKDCLEVMKGIEDESIWFALYDPIYTDRQQDEIKTYSIKGTNYKSHPEYFQKVEEELMRIIAPKGRVLKFMFNGKRIPGFEKYDGLIVEHGGQHNATICTAHQKVQGKLF